MSFKEEVEQDVINRSIKVDTDRRITTGLLPLMFNRLHKLDHKKDKALYAYNQKGKNFNQKPQGKKDVIQSEGKLQTLGHMEFVRNLTPEQQEMLAKNSVQNFILWRAIWNSLSTHCRLAFDVSQPTASGTSLNDILAKGKNNMK